MPDSHNLDKGTVRFLYFPLEGVLPGLDYSRRYFQGVYPL
jgi:hypothetical protein